jgi:Flp pilus assembly pilin Flp
MLCSMQRYLRDDSGSVTVDYTVIGAGAIAMAIAATTVLVGGIDFLTGRVDEELRTRQLSDSYVDFTSAHFNEMYKDSSLTEEDAETLFLDTNKKMNQDIIDIIEDGITKVQDGTITEPELAELYAAASVAYQRNIINDGFLDYWFGFGGSDPAATMASVPD